MNMKRISRRRKEAMKSKEHRDAFIEEFIKTGVPFQIRKLREKEGWTQKELGDRAKMAQERVSVLEDPNYSKFTIPTLLKLASAFDVGLMVRFVPFSKVFFEAENLSETLAPASYHEDEDLHKENQILASGALPTIGTSLDAGPLMFLTGAASVARMASNLDPIYMATNVMPDRIFACSA